MKGSPKKGGAGKRVVSGILLRNRKLENQDRIMVKLTFFILSVLVAVIWIGVPFILAFIFIMSVIDDSGDKKQKEEKK